MPRTAVISLMLLRSGVLVGDDGPELLTDQAREGVEARIAFAKFIGLALDEAGVAAAASSPSCQPRATSQAAIAASATAGSTPSVPPTGAAPTPPASGATAGRTSTQP
jgi:hypothetical protein